MKISIRKVGLRGATCLTALASIGTTSAYAQDEPVSAEAGVEEGIVDEESIIIVTGSRLQRTSADTREPSVIIGSDLLDERGVTTVGEALEGLPAFGIGTTAVGTQSGSFGSGQSFVNFFGLGSQRTLTLVNGRRYIGSNTSSIFGPTDPGGQVDLNTIPTLMVERIESIAVGGAPVYGSDAIAGTVNIILRDKFDGIKLGGQYGISSRGDAREYRLQGLAGTSFAGGRGDIVAAYEYSKSAGLLGTDRRITARGRFFTTPADPDYPFNNELIENRRIAIMSQFGIPMAADIIPGFGADIYDGAGNTLAFNRDGQLVPFDFGTPTGSVVDASGGDGLNLVELSNLLSQVERHVGYVRASYELTDNIKAFTEFSYARSKGTNLRDQPVYNSWLFDDAGEPSGNLIIPLSNPFLTDQQRATIAASLPAGQDFFYLGRANTDLYSGRGSSTVELYRIVGGLEGDFESFGKDFHWDLTANYGRSKSKGRSQEVVQQNFLNALAGCPDGYTNSPIATGSATCVPFNPFGQRNGSDVKNYITTTAKPVSDNEQIVLTASVSGEVFDIWGGGVGVAIGYEHRQEKAVFDPGAFYYGAVDPADPTGPRTSYGRSIPIDAVNGKFNTDEIFGELKLPIVSPDMNIPFVHALEISGAARYVNHSLSGGDITWSAGGRWSPIEDFSIRGNYTRSIRSPAITELFNPTSAIFTLADDPCDSRFINSGPNPATRQANCAADGLPANFTSTIVSATAEGSLSGNPDLDNETAKSWTIGAILTPRALPGFSLSVDWVSIKLSNAIISLDADQTMQACYDSPSFPNTACGQIDRGADGQVDFIRTGYVNAASFDYAGLLAEMTYTTRTPFLGVESSIDLKASYQYIDTLEQRVGAGDLTTLRGAAGYSKHQVTASATYRNGPFGAFLQAEYIGPSYIDPDASPDAYAFPRRKAVTFFNGSLSFDVDDQFTLRFIVDNIFDTNAPFPVPADGGTVAYFDGIMGRYLKVAATVDF